MKLSQDLQISLSVALNEAANRGHEFVTLEHLLFALVHDQETAAVIRQCGGNVGRLKKKLDAFLNDQLESVPETKRRAPRPSLAFQRALSRAAAHVEGAGKEEVSGANVLVAIFAEQECWAAHFLNEEGVTRLDVVTFISHGVSKLEDDEGTLAPAGADEDEDEEGEGNARGKEGPLEAYATNLNELAAAGRIDPLIGREREIKRTLHILARRRKNNPLFVGDSGVGKTAIVEGLALKIHRGEVPEMLKAAVIYNLDMGALLAGTRYRGDFENRMKAVLKALAKQPDAILFIDELHTVIGAGSASGSTLDASNLLKPALTSGTLRCIGSTTYEEFKQHLERDRALMRRFQRIEVNEPSIEETVQILEGLRTKYEAHHGVRYTKEALRTAAELSSRYLQEKKLPDKAIDLLDEAGAAARLAAQKDTRITSREVESVLATMAQIPPRRVSRDDRERLQALDAELKQVVFGQDYAIDQLVGAIKMSRAGLGTPDRPVGSYLLTGPTGVGKTEVAKQLAATLSLEFMRFDMSEYMERHTVSRLIGAPPGYVGFDQGGLLTDAVRRTPHAVLLLDEIEKAHPDVFNLLLQVMDHGTLTDNNGKKADFRHVILLMTSNVGSRELEKRRVGFGEAGGDAGQADEEYRRLFSPEFRNRLDARIRFNALSPVVMGQIVDKFIAQLGKQLGERKVSIELSEAARAELADKGFDPKFGARPLARVIQEQVKRPLSEDLLFGRLAKGGLVRVDFVEGKMTFEVAGTPMAPVGGDAPLEQETAPEEEELYEDVAPPTAAGPSA
ncbi:MAG: ATP-dependent Clp protease ATP-binding subunit ClpA [Deltaproteobacteria bacterium]|nr:ATP-dependent Clp protease ATP-binding subunit ClpA [Deltaproteobacteria bacterium]